MVDDDELGIFFSHFPRYSVKLFRFQFSRCEVLLKLEPHVGFASGLEPSFDSHKICCRLFEESQHQGRNDMITIQDFRHFIVLVDIGDK